VVLFQKVHISTLFNHFGSLKVHISTFWKGSTTVTIFVPFFWEFIIHFFGYQVISNSIPHLNIIITPNTLQCVLNKSKLWVGHIQKLSKGRAYTELSIYRIWAKIPLWSQNCQSLQCSVSLQNEFSCENSYQKAVYIAQLPSYVSYIIFILVCY